MYLIVKSFQFTQPAGNLSSRVSLLPDKPKWQVVVWKWILPAQLGANFLEASTMVKSSFFEVVQSFSALDNALEWYAMGNSCPFLYNYKSTLPPVTESTDPAILLPYKFIKLSLKVGKVMEQKPKNALYPFNEIV